jgi:hypothetical protein
MRHLKLAPLFALGLALAPSSARAADPTTADCLGASESSIKLRGEHKLREARAQLLVCAAATCPDDVRSECERHVTEVNASIPTIVFEAKDASGADLTAVKVTMDGAVLVERLEGTAISLDPGEHSFTFEVAGQAPVQKSLVLREGEKDRRERVTLGAAAALAAPAAPLASPPPGDAPSVESAPPPPPASDSSGGSWSSQKTWAVVLGGAGLVGIGVGTAFGLSAGSAWSRAQTECGSPTSCPQHAQAVSDHDSASNAATWSTVGFGVGAAAIVAGVVLWATAPSGGKSATASGVQVLPTMGDRTGGLAVSGRF